MHETNNMHQIVAEIEHRAFKYFKPIESLRVPKMNFTCKTVSWWTKIFCVSLAVYESAKLVLAIYLITMYIYNDVLRSQTWRRGTKCDCKINWLWVRSPVKEFALVSRQSMALSSATHGCNASLCIPSRVRNTAWSWIIIAVYNNFIFVDFRSNM